MPYLRKSKAIAKMKTKLGNKVQKRRSTNYVKNLKVQAEALNINSINENSDVSVKVNPTNIKSAQAEDNTNRYPVILLPKLPIEYYRNNNYSVIEKRFALTQENIMKKATKNSKNYVNVEATISKVEVNNLKVLNRSENMIAETNLKDSDNSKNILALTSSTQNLKEKRKIDNSKTKKEPNIKVLNNSNNISSSIDEENVASTSSTRNLRQKMKKDNYKTEKETVTTNLKALNNSKNIKSSIDGENVASTSSTRNLKQKIKIDDSKTEKENAKTNLKALNNSKNIKSSADGENVASTSSTQNLRSKRKMDESKSEEEVVETNLKVMINSKNIKSGKDEENVASTFSTRNLRQKMKKDDSKTEKETVTTNLKALNNSKNIKSSADGENVASTSSTRNLKQKIKMDDSETEKETAKTNLKALNNSKNITDGENVASTSSTRNLRSKRKMDESKSEEEILETNIKVMLNSKKINSGKDEENVASTSSTRNLRKKRKIDESKIKKEVVKTNLKVLNNSQNINSSVDEENMLPPLYTTKLRQKKKIDDSKSEKENKSVVKTNLKVLNKSKTLKNMDLAAKMHKLGRINEIDDSKSEKKTTLKVLKKSKNINSSIDEEDMNSPSLKRSLRQRNRKYEDSSQIKSAIVIIETINTINYQKDFKKVPLVELQKTPSFVFNQEKLEHEMFKNKLQIVVPKNEQNCVIEKVLQTQIKNEALVVKNSNLDGKNSDVDLHADLLLKNSNLNVKSIDLDIKVTDFEAKNKNNVNKRTIGSKDSVEAIRLTRTQARKLVQQGQLENPIKPKRNYAKKSKNIPKTGPTKVLHETDQETDENDPLADSLKVFQTNLHTNRETRSNRKLIDEIEEEFVLNLKESEPETELLNHINDVTQVDTFEIIDDDEDLNETTNLQNLNPVNKETIKSGPEDEFKTPKPGYKKFKLMMKPLVLNDIVNSSEEEDEIIFLNKANIRKKSSIPYGSEDELSSPHPSDSSVKYTKRMTLSARFSKMRNVAETSIPIYMRKKAPLLPTHDPYDSDEEQTSDVRREKPHWLTRENMHVSLKTSSFVPPVYKYNLFTVEPQSPDLQEIFINIDPKKLCRNSSAIWYTRPKFCHALTPSTSL